MTQLPDSTKRSSPAALARGDEASTTTPQSNQVQDASKYSRVLRSQLAGTATEWSVADEVASVPLRLRACQATLPVDSRPSPERDSLIV